MGDIYKGEDHLNTQIVKIADKQLKLKTKKIKDHLKNYEKTQIDEDVKLAKQKAKIGLLPV